jgi:hypothetical protein
VGTLAPPPPATAAAVAPPLPARIPWHVHAVVFSSLCVLVGVIWDISWHQSIGRDSLFSAPHLAIYLGGVVAGVTCGWVVLRTTFAGSPGQRDAAVSFWRIFRGPLGAWVCIWGTFAMLTSAPFDDWWHNAFGLDTKILSPPHALLAAGIGAINLGAMIMVAPLVNAAEGSRRRMLAQLYLVTCGLMLIMFGTMASESHYRIYMHGTGFYVAAAIAFPLVLAAAARSAPVRWPATTAAGVYSIVTLVMMWILPLFPAEARLAPINHQVTSMVPPSFPLLVIAPALVYDLVMRRFGEVRRDTLLALCLGILFVLTFMAAQMPFAVFLMSDAAQNPLFAADNFPYQVSHQSYYYRRLFLPTDTNEASYRLGMLTAMIYAVVTTRVGLAWGNWLRRVRR